MTRPSGEVARDGSAPSSFDTVVVGAGPGGLAAAAELKRRGVPAVVLERDSVGASWRRHYDRLHLHTVRWLSHLPGLRLSRAHGRWVSREGVVRYLERYVRHHGLEVRTGCEVERIDPSPAGWTLTTSDGPVEARAVVVATGYNRRPRWPDWPGQDAFAGELIHGQEYRNAAPYRGKDVLVVGAGNTAAEICVDLAEGGAGRVQLAIRTPPNILLREVGGVPAQVTGLMLSRLPTRVADPIARVAQRATVGDLSSHGLPPAPRGVATQAVRDDQIPILDVGLVELVKRGRVEIVPAVAVAGFDADGVTLVGGRRVDPEVVIACTGYERALEGLVGHLSILGDKGRPTVDGAQTDPRYPDLHFIGYSNPLSGMFRQFGIDAKRIARYQRRRRSGAR